MGPNGLNNGNGVTENKITYVLYRQVSLIIGVISLAIAVYIGLTSQTYGNKLQILSLEYKINTLLTNDIPHLQALLDQMSSRYEISQNKVIEMDKKLDRVIILLEEHTKE